MITQGFYDALACLHGGDQTARITTIGFGTGSAAETEADAALSDDAYTKPIDSVESLERCLRFHWSLGRAEAVGLPIQEIGLFTAGGVLVVRQVRARPIHKAEDMELGDVFDIQL